MDIRIFSRIAESVKKNPQMEEDEMTLCYDKEGFFSTLGYKEYGIDIRSQKLLKSSEKRPDRFCLDELGNIVFVFESKRPNDIEFEKVQDPYKIKYLEELWEKYVVPLKASYGILTNGKRFILYERMGVAHQVKLDIYDIVKIKEEESILIENLLKKPDRVFSNIREIKNYIESDIYGGLLIDQTLDIFYDSYSLDPNSYFGQLLKTIYQLFKNQYKKNEKNFYIGGV